jgi:hypothetical protein
LNFENKIYRSWLEVFNKAHGNNPYVVDPLVCHLRGIKILSIALFALSIALFALSTFLA